MLISANSSLSGATPPSSGLNFEELRKLLQDQSSIFQQAYTQALSQLERANREHAAWLKQQQQQQQQQQQPHCRQEESSVSIVDVRQTPSPLVDGSAKYSTASLETPELDRYRASTLNVPEEYPDDDLSGGSRGGAEAASKGQIPSGQPSAKRELTSSSEPMASMSAKASQSAHTLKVSNGASPSGAPIRHSTPKASHTGYMVPHAIRANGDGVITSSSTSAVFRMVSSARSCVEYHQNVAHSLPPTSLSRLVERAEFKVITTLAILVNALCIGAEKEHLLTLMFEGKSLSEDEQAILWSGIEIFWCTFFTVELIFRAAAERKAFVCGHRWKWNAFDLFLVMTSLLSLGLSAYKDQNTPDFQFARILRLFRFTRVLRLLRAMRFSQSLRLIMFSILASLFSLFWVVCIMMFVIYFFSVFFLAGIIDDYDSSGALDADTLELVHLHYGSLPKTILSLFMCISGGRDWADVMDPLWDIGEFYIVGFVLYILFMAIGVMNVVTGHFVDSAAQVAAKDREALVKNEIKQEKEYVARMRAIFREADKDNNGTLSWEEFEEHLNEPHAAAYFGTLGLDSTIARTLFLLLDVNDTNSVSIDEFVGGCMRLKGTARSIDVNMLLYENEKMIVKIVDSIDMLGRKLTKVSRSMGYYESEQEDNNGDMSNKPTHHAALARLTLAKSGMFGDGNLCDDEGSLLSDDIGDLAKASVMAHRRMMG